VFKDITEHNKAEEKIIHLNLTLSTISNVNQLIIKEKNRDVLIQEVCEILIKNHGYENAWIVLLGKDGEYLNSAESGLGKNFLPMKKMLEEGELPDCAKKTLKTGYLVIIKDPKKDCLDCPLSRNYAEHGGFSISLKHESTVYGILTVSVPLSFLYEETEQNLFKEVSEDLGFALNSIEVEKKYRKSVDDLIKQKDFSEKIIETSSAIIVGLDIDHRIRLFNEGAEKITGYKKEEVIGEDWFHIFLPSEMLEEMEKVWKDAWGFSSHSHANQILSKTGEKRMISWQTTGFYEEKDEKNYLLISIGEDITSQKKAEEEILRLKDGLEIQVAEKTKELNEKINELERFYDATIDREFRIKELNDRIEELEDKLKKKG